MKKAKQLLCTILALCMIITSVAVVSKDVHAEAKSGKDGQIQWQIKGDTLTISAVEGTAGEMKDYGYCWDEETETTVLVEAPWEKSSAMKKVKQIVIKDGVTKLGRYAFASSKIRVESLEIAGTIKNIPTEFSNLGGLGELKEVTIHEGVETIESSAFMNTKIYTLKIPKSVKNIEINAFSTVAGGIMIYLRNVYGYIGSEAEKYVNDYIGLAEDYLKAKETGDFSKLDGWYYIFDENGNYTTKINFIALDDVSALSTAKVTSEITVKKKKCEKIKVMLPTGLLQVSKYTGNPADVKVTFKSSNKNIATVNSKGKVTGKKKGTAKITVTMQIENGAKKTVSTKIIVK